MDAVDDGRSTRLKLLRIWWNIDLRATLLARIGDLNWRVKYN